MIEPELEDVPAEVVRFAEDFVVDDKRVSMPLPLLTAWRDSIAALPPDTRRDTIAGVVVIAAQLQASNPEGAEYAVVQMLALLTALLGGEREAREILAEGGVETGRAQTLLNQAKKGKLKDKKGNVVIDSDTSKYPKLED